MSISVVDSQRASVDASLGNAQGCRCSGQVRSTAVGSCHLSRGVPNDGPNGRFLADPTIRWRGHERRFRGELRRWLRSRAVDDLDEPRMALPGGELPFPTCPCRDPYPRRGSRVSADVEILSLIARLRAPPTPASPEDGIRGDRRRRRHVFKGNRPVPASRGGQSSAFDPRASVMGDADCAAGPKARRWPSSARESGGNVG
jgi:hypothetical protein